jgi:dTDP-4-amino-4,6-dideoxygalactose transaminase
LVDLPLRLPPAAPDGVRHAYHLFAVQVPDRRRVYEHLRAAGIATQVHYVPIYRHPAYAEPDDGPERFPHTEQAYAGLLSLPLFPALGEDEQDQVVTALRSALERP